MLQVKIAPISANVAISVNQPGMTKSNATNLIAKKKVMFCLMIAKALRLNFVHMAIYSNHQTLRRVGRF